MPVTYFLGVDLGTTFSAAALARDGRAEMFVLGARAPSIPSVIVMREHGEVLVGEAAERRALSEPSRTAREFKRRLGDPTPLLLGGTPYGAEALMSYLLRAVVEQVVEREGAPPAAIVLGHPANYGPYKKDLLVETARQADVGQVTFVSEPEAAAVYYASRQRMEPGQVVAVYDFGGGTFDAAMVRKTEDGFALVGTPEGMERLGGIDFDQAIFAHVADALGGLVQDQDLTDSGALKALTRLRADCRAAKEALSTDTDATIPVLLPNVQTDVRITRDEFEDMIRPRVAETVAALKRAVRSAGISTDDLVRILLVGGSSRIPLVGQMVREGTGRPVTVDADPKFAIPLGAALAGEQRAATAVPETPITHAEPPPTVAPEPAAPVAPSPAPTATPAAVAPSPPSSAGGASPPAVTWAPVRHEPRRRRSRLPFMIAGGVALAIVIMVALISVLVLAGDGGGGGKKPSGQALTASERTLRTHVPSEFRRTCKSNKDNPAAGQVAALECSPNTNNADTVQYIQLDSAASLDSAYQGVLDANHVARDSGDACTQTGGEGALTNQTQNGAEVGRYVCYVDNGNAFEWWTVDDLKILSLAVDSSADLKALDTWWQENAGPY
jgi:molecular chaperone DnaK